MDFMCNFSVENLLAPKKGEYLEVRHSFCRMQAIATYRRDRRQAEPEAELKTVNNLKSAKESSQQLPLTGVWSHCVLEDHIKNMKKTFEGQALRFLVKNPVAKEESRGKHVATWTHKNNITLYLSSPDSLSPKTVEPFPLTMERCL